MLRKKILIPIVLLILFIALFSLSTKRNETTLRVNRQNIELEIANTPEKRKQGLSGKSRLEAHKGMLFVFDRTEPQCMWMKDMKFGLDMVWFDSQYRTTKIERNVSPATYPNSFCGEGRFVLEVNAGTADAVGLRVGDHVNVSL